MSIWLFAAMVLCDADGAQLFTKAGDVERLGRKSAAALDRILDAGMKLNRIRPEDVDDAEKN